MMHTSVARSEITARYLFRGRREEELGIADRVRYADLHINIYIQDGFRLSLDLKGRANGKKSTEGNDIRQKMTI
jgi:hypothetical protein